MLWLRREDMEVVLGDTVGDRLPLLRRVTVLEVDCVRSPRDLLIRPIPQ